MKKTSAREESFEEDVNRNVENIVGFFKSKIGSWILVGMFFVIIIILFAGSKSSTVISSDTEKKLADIIGKLEGVESATVMITYNSITQKASATNQSLNPTVSGNNNISSKLITGVMEDTLIADESEIRGVIVVAKGADDYMVRMNIIDAVTTGLNVSADKVEVLCMK